MPPRDASDSFAGLPELLREVAEVAGLDAAMQLVRHRGGTEVVIPRKAGSDHWLAQAVGLDAAARICERFRVMDADGHVVGMYKVYVPFAGEGLMARTLADLARALETENLSTRDAVRRFGLSNRTVKRVRAKLRASHQLPLL